MISHNSYNKFSYEILHKNRFIISRESQIFIKEFKEKIKDNIAEIKSGTLLYRTQKGNSYRSIYQDNIEVDEIPCAFEKDRMKPLKSKAKEGRINPKGIPYLYLSDDIKTAISEVRPWIGDQVSIGLFEIIRDLKLIHFTDERRSHIFYINGPPKEKYDEIVWNDINRAFSKPISDDEKTAEYIPTQYLAEIIKNMKYDGIIYKSKVNQGLNFALFDIEAAELRECYLVEIDKTNIEYHQSDSPYKVRKKETEQPLQPYKSFGMVCAEISCTNNAKPSQKLRRGFKG